MMASHTTLEQKFVELENSWEALEYYRQPKIQRVPELLKNRENCKKHYSPKFVSIGPIHHDKVNLKLGEKYKLLWAAKYIDDAELNPQNLHKIIVDNIDELKDLFADDVLTCTGESLEGFCSVDEKLSWILFVDGCSLLHILSDECKLDLKDHQRVNVMMDVLLLENQLPYLLLKLLWKNENETELKDIMKNFLASSHWVTPPKETKLKETVFSVLKKKKEEHSVLIPDESGPTHLLDLHHRIILTKSSSKGLNRLKENVDEMLTYRSIQDLRAVGIKFKSSATRRPSDIDFSEGWFNARLTLPEIVVDNNTKTTYLNLIAYEMCPDFQNDYEICSFASFMDSLIDHSEDVRELRSKGILLNCLGSDEKVADLFNTISTDLCPDTITYHEVRAKIQKHYYNKYKTWIALGIHTYFNNPWAFIAFLAAFIALALTFVQTWFAINPNEANK